MAKQPRVWSGSQWEPLAVTLPDLSNYSTTTQMNTAIGANAGLNLISSQTFTTASSVQFDNCFTSSYTNYKILVNITARSANGAVNFRLVDGTTPLTGANYFWSWYGSYIDGTVYRNYTAGADVFFSLAEGNTSYGENYSASADIFAPQLARLTNYSFNFNGRNATNRGSGNGGGTTDVTTQFEGIQFFPASGTFSGTIKIYGYKD